MSNGWHLQVLPPYYPTLFSTVMIKNLHHPAIRGGAHYTRRSLTRATTVANIRLNALNYRIGQHGVFPHHDDVAQAAGPEGETKLAAEAFYKGIGGGSVTVVVVVVVKGSRGRTEVGEKDEAAERGEPYWAGGTFGEDWKRP